MKNDYSMQGLSQILQESDREDFQNAKHLLAKLNNEEYLNQYVQLNSIVSDYKQKHQSLLQTPISVIYKRFGNQELEKQQLAKKQLAQKMRQFELSQKAILSKQQLKLCVSRKLQEKSQKQKLQVSLNEKRHMYFEMLKTSRSFQTEYYLKEGFTEMKAHKSCMESDKRESQKKKVDAFVEQTVEDVFLRLQVLGEERDEIKKKWYSWGEHCGITQKKKIIDNWGKLHDQIKEILEQLLERLTVKVGSGELFRQLRIQNISILKPVKRTAAQKSMNSTGILGSVSKEQTKMIVKFSQWYNKLLLDQRELEYIHVQYS